MFQAAYLKYVAKHNRAMRNRPPAHRLLPKAVVECVDPDLLEYICRKGLKKRYRSKNPATVPAARIHKWVMRKKRNRLGAEDGEGLKKLKAVRIDLSGEGGVRSVQTAFIEIRKIRKEHKIQLKEEEIIKNLGYELKPLSTRTVIKNILKQDNRQSNKARKRLDKYHDLLMQFAKTFQEASELGLVAPKEQKPNPKNSKNPRNPKTPKESKKP